MASIFKKNKLSFSEFPSPTVKDWENQIASDLKGEDYTIKFNWHTQEGISHLPFYENEDNYKTQAAIPPLSDWKICQYISTPDCKNANKLALHALESGASSLYFDLPSNALANVSDLKILLDGIILDILTIHFSESLSQPEHLEIIQTFVTGQSIHENDLDFKFNSDPFTNALKTGKLLSKSDFKTDTNLNSLAVNAHFYGNAGATMVDQLAFAAATGNEYLDFSDNTDQVAQQVHFNFSVASNYFLEIAKLRAFRLIWSQILDTYQEGLSQKYPAYIHAHTATLNTSLKDPHNNILRATTEAMSAAIGVADAITITPFDDIYNEENSFSDRIARNIQLILKEEAYFDKVADPSAGSYYIEHLTTHLAEEAWKVFQEIERNGGFYNSIKNGFVQKRVREAQQARMDASKNGELVLLGVNKHPAKDEEARKPRLKPESKVIPKEAYSEIETISEFRIAEAFETETLS
ncbi:MAG: methylmalonyl-CoA mutase subunit beta [Balneolaceae bacterium]